MPEKNAIKPKDDEDEEDAGDVDAKEELAEREERGDSILADGEGHGPEGTKWGKFHDEGDDFECDVGKLVGQARERAIFIERYEGESNEDGEQQDLKNLTFGKRIDEAIGTDIEEVVDAAQALCPRRCTG